MPMGGLLVGVLDTNILMRAGLLEFLFDVHANGAYRARWSASISLELDEHLPRRGPHIAARIGNLLSAVPDAELPVAAEDTAAAAGACDPDDEHVLATALCARRLEPEAGVALVTGDIDDFDVEAAAGRGVRVVGPDAFGLLLLERDAVPVLRAVQRRPSHRYHRFLGLMSDDGLPETADRIRQWFEEVAL